MLLSILTPSIPRRAAKLAALSQRITPWLGPEIEWLVLTDDRPSGPKRNEMMDAARGSYVAHIDDDEDLDPRFPDYVLPALRSGKDVILYDALASLNGSPFFRVNIGHGHANEQPRHLPDGRLSDIRRHEWHFNCWKTELARKGRFPQEHNGAEDAIWLAQVIPLVGTWLKIEEPPMFIHRWSKDDSTFDGPARL
jgi:hypothetical protein